MYPVQALWYCSSSGYISGGAQGKQRLVQVHRGRECLNGRSEGWFLLPGARCSPHAEVGHRSILCLLFSVLLSPGTQRWAVSPAWPGKGWAGRLHCETAPALYVQSKTPLIRSSSWEKIQQGKKRHSQFGLWSRFHKQLKEFAWEQATIPLLLLVKIQENRYTKWKRWEQLALLYSLSELNLDQRKCLLFLSCLKIKCQCLHCYNVLLDKRCLLFLSPWVSIYRKL